MNKGLSILLLLINFAAFSQTRKVGLDTLTLSKLAISAFPDSSFNLNKRVNYCIELDATKSIDPIAPNLEYFWTIDRIHKTKGTIVEHCFPKPGNHFISLSIYDPKIDQMVLNDTVFNLSIPSALRFKKGGFYKILNTVTLVTDDYKVPKNSFLLWDFGDETTSTQTNPTHTYNDAGTFEVMLIATNDCDSDTIIQQVIIEDIETSDQQFDPNVDPSSSAMTERPRNGL